MADLVVGISATFVEGKQTRMGDRNAGNDKRALKTVRGDWVLRNRRCRQGRSITLGSLGCLLGRGTRIQRFVDIPEFKASERVNKLRN